MRKTGGCRPQRPLRPRPSNAAFRCPAEATRFIHLLTFPCKRQQQQNRREHTRQVAADADSQKDREDAMFGLVQCYCESSTQAGRRARRRSRGVRSFPKNSANLPNTASDTSSRLSTHRPHASPSTMRLTCQFFRSTRITAIASSTKPNSSLAGGNTIWPDLDPTAAARVQKITTAAANSTRRLACPRVAEGNPGASWSGKQQAQHAEKRREEERKAAARGGRGDAGHLKSKERHESEKDGDRGHPKADSLHPARGAK